MRQSIVSVVANGTDYVHTLALIQDDDAGEVQTLAVGAALVARSQAFGAVGVAAPRQ